MLVEKDRKAERVLIDITKVQQKSQAAADNAQVLCLFLRHFLMYGRDKIVGSNLNPGVLQKGLKLESYKVFNQQITAL